MCEELESLSSACFMEYETVCVCRSVGSAGIGSGQMRMVYVPTAER